MELLLNIASTFPKGAFAPAHCVQAALDDGYEGVSILPTWGFLLPTNLRQYVRYVEKPWNPGTPWAWFRGLVTGDPKTPKVHDWLLFPWFSTLWQRKYGAILSWGAIPVVHTLDAHGIVELSPGIQMSGLEAVKRAHASTHKVCFDTYHAVRELGPFEGGPTPSPLGDWREWLAESIRLQMLVLFDFHPTPKEALKGGFAVQMEMLQFALEHGFTGNIRVEVTLPLLKQLRHSRQTTQRLRKTITQAIT